MTGAGEDLTAWLPTLEEVVAKLGRGAKVADVGCGEGASTILMAQRFPKSRFFGYDAHPKSIELARLRAVEAGVADRVTFDVASSSDFPGREYDLVCLSDCLRDIESPAATARRVKEVLAPGGTWIMFNLVLEARL